MSVFNSSDVRTGKPVYNSSDFETGMSAYNSSGFDTSMSLYNSSGFNPGVPIVMPMYISIWITVINVVVFLIGAVGNSFVIAIVVKFREMRSPTNWCLVNWSVSDLLVLIVCQSSALAEFYAKDRWLFGDVLCRLIPFLEILVTHATILIMLGISYGRYFAVCYPLESYSTCSRGRAFLMMALAWIFASLSAIPFIFMSNTESATFLNDNTQVSVCRTHISQVWQKSFIVGTFVVYFVIPFFILAFVYARTIYTIITESKLIANVINISKQRSMRSRQQLVLMLLIIVVLFFLCVLPMRIVILWLVFSDPRTIEGLGLEAYYNITWVARVLQYTNSAVNPIIYNVFSVKFRKAFSRLLFPRSRHRRRELSLTVSGGRGGTKYSFMKMTTKDTGHV